MADINLTAAEVAQLILSIGNAAALSTKDKTSLVAAINETLATAEAGGSPKAEKVSYSGNIDGTTVANVKAALDALTAREQALVVRFTKQSSGTITADKTIAAILAAHSSGKPVTGIYANGDYQLLEAQGSVAYFASWTGVDTFMLKGAASAGVDSWTLERLDIKGTNVALKGNIDGEDFTTVASAIAILNRRGADHVAYSGTIGETTVANVKAALDALAVGNPLDMTADYVASGATSVEQWATMAAAQTATEGAALPTPEYRVAAGRYRIVDNDNSEEHDVTIMDVPADPQRIVLISRITVDPFWYFDVCSVAEPGSNPAWLLSLSTEENLLSLTDGCVKLLPGYNKSADSNDADKILMLKSKPIAGNTNVYPSWGSLPMATASAAGGVKADAKTEDDTVPARIDTDGKLWVKVPDAPLIVTASNIQDDTGTVDYSESEILAAVSAGREVYLRLRVNDLAHVLAFGGTLQGKPFFYNIYTRILANGAMLAMVEGNQVYVNDAGFATTDDLVVFKNTIELQLLPEVTDADNGKFARVVNGAWAAQALTNVSEVGA